MPEPTEPTPRPWIAQSRDDGASFPWYLDTHAYPDGPEPVWAPPQYPIREADITLIVEAVNNYDRLKRIEQAAQAVVDSETYRSGIGVVVYIDADMLDALRTTLEEK